eukprot:5276019-Ditylum_brightwellii.AAC.1
MQTSKGGNDSGLYKKLLRLGGQEGRVSVDVVALTRFTTETHHYQQCNAATTYCDTKSCYVHITPELLALLYAKTGCPLAVVEFFYSALTQLEFSMSTTLGILDQKNASTQ